jgi:hypothetical protein
VRNIKYAANQFLPVGIFWRIFRQIFEIQISGRHNCPHRAGQSILTAWLFCQLLWTRWVLIFRKNFCNKNRNDLQPSAISNASACRMWSCYWTSSIVNWYTASWRTRSHKPGNILVDPNEIRQNIYYHNSFQATFKSPRPIDVTSRRRRAKSTIPSYSIFYAKKATTDTLALSMCPVRTWPYNRSAGLRTCIWKCNKWDGWNASFVSLSMHEYLTKMRIFMWSTLCKLQGEYKVVPGFQTQK